MSADRKLLEYLSLRKITKTLLSIIGLWPFPNPSVVYCCLPYLYILVSSVTVLGILSFIYNHITRVAIVVRGMSIGTSFLSEILRILRIITHRRRIFKLHYTLEEDFTEVLRNDKSTEQVLTGIIPIRRLSSAFLITVFMSVMIYIIIPIVEISRQKRHNIHPIKYPLIYPAVYPWDTSSQGLIYKIQFGIETFASVSMFCVTCGVDALFTLYIFQMTGLLRGMVQRLTSEDEKFNVGIVLKECILRYRTLLMCRDSIEIIFGPIIVWMMGTNAIVLCALVFQLTQISSFTLFRAVLTTSYFILKIIQTFLYSWSGTRLTTQSEKYREAIYQVNWFGKRSIMTSIIIMLNQRPLVLRPIGSAVISIDMFVAILNTTISYFFLLKTMEQKS